ncbi:MAG: hypothetical protein HY611_05165 [Elusimicrobia bacterium]|nr:hypothetical protein [Elusimicrobiota bacterium]
MRGRHAPLALPSSLSAAKGLAVPDKILMGLPLQEQGRAVLNKSLDGPAPAQSGDVTRHWRFHRP